MDPMIVKLGALTVAALGLVVYLTLVSNGYRSYYKRMKQEHPDEWRRLMAKDSMVNNMGTWTRWPLGSSYLFMSVFQRDIDYGDSEIGSLKRQVVSRLVGAMLAFIIVLVYAALAPHVSS